MKITISGWPGAGTTTLTLILATLLEYEYLYAGGLFKFFAINITGGDSGDEVMQFENGFGKEWDHAWERYAEMRLKQPGNLILEGKTAGFLYFGDNLFKIMLTCSVEERAKRWKSEDRKDAEETIRRRDAEVGARWQELFGFDLYDVKSFKEKYQFNFVLDTGSLTISEEALEIIKALGKDISKESVERLEKEYWEGGKPYLQNLLAEKKLLNTPESILHDWSKVMPDEVAKLPAKMKEVVLRYQ